MKYLNFNRRLILFSTFIILFIAVVVIWQSILSLPKPWNRSLEYSVKVVDKNSQLLRLFTTSKGYWRFPVKLSQLDKNFISALIDYEDKRFYQHSGIDFLAIIRAIKQLI
ncbi:MAG: transglycosylase domain-containing protein, partial [Thiotrichaceae bacterium]|nr:transglycosylase domain-containing protein [Thiotrichaceae bacterium]